MKSLDRDTKLSITEIIFSPILALWNMASSNEDIPDEIELNPNSSDRTEAYLANSQKEVDEEVKKYGMTKVSKRAGKIQGIKVDNISLENVRQKQEMHEQAKQVKEEKALDEK